MKGIVMPYIVISSIDYADEFDCNQFCIFDTKEHLDDWLNDTKLSIREGRNEFWFGTNEALYIESVEELEDSITIRELSEEDAAVIKKYIGRYFGTGGLF